MSLFSKAAKSATNTVNPWNKAGMRGRSMVAGMVQKRMNDTGRYAGAAVGLWNIAAKHPIQTAGILVAGGALYDYGGRDQSIPEGPVSQSQRPGSVTQNKFDLGASGDLVFALNRLR